MDGSCDIHFRPKVHLCMTHDIGLLNLSEMHVLTSSVHFISHNSTVPVFTATVFRLASERGGTVSSCLSIFINYTYRENVGVITLTWLRMIMYPTTSSMGDHVANSSETGPDLRSFLKYNSCNSSHCKNCKYLLLQQMSNSRV